MPRPVAAVPLTLTIPPVDVMGELPDTAMPPAETLLITTPEEPASAAFTVTPSVLVTSALVMVLAFR